VTLPSDTVQVAIVLAVGGIIAAMLQRNHKATEDVGRTAKAISVNVDGNLTKMTAKFEEATAAILAAREDSKYREGFKDGSEHK
jgi:hypothetical protein